MTSLISQGGAALGWRQGTDNLKNRCTKKRRNRTKQEQRAGFTKGKSGFMANGRKKRAWAGRQGWGGGEWSEVTAECLSKYSKNYCMIFDLRCYTFLDELLNSFSFSLNIQISNRKSNDYWYRTTQGISRKHIKQYWNMMINSSWLSVSRSNLKCWR